MIQKPNIPKFASEAEEAEWWYANREWLAQEFLQAAKEGTLRRGSSLVERLRRTPQTKRYAVVIEKAPDSNYSAYVPDLPGCIAAGETLEETKRLIREAITFHLEGMREDGEPIPEPTTEVDYVEAPAA